MDLNHCETLAKSLMQKHNVPSDWSFGWNTRKLALGLCEYGPRRISLSIEYARLNTEAEVIDTILHEIAHVLAGRAGHGYMWKVTARRIGCSAQRCADSTQIIIPKMKYTLTCPTCGTTIQRDKITRRVLTGYCSLCHRSKGIKSTFKVTRN